MRVKTISPVSSYSILLRQHFPQPSQSASHSAAVISESGTSSQNRGRRGGGEGMPVIRAWCDKLAQKESAMMPLQSAPQSAARISRAAAQSASICAMSASRLSKTASGRRKATKPTAMRAP